MNKLRGQVSSVFVIALFAQSLHGRSQSPRHQPPPEVHYLETPFIQEGTNTSTGVNADGTPRRPVVSTRLSMMDSQGRRLFSDTLISSGRRTFQVDDPIAGVEIVWNTSVPIAKVFKYPTPVPDQKSCWKMAREALDLRRGEPPIGLSGITCMPAGQHQTPYCGRQSEATTRPPADNSPPAKPSFESCVGSLASVVKLGDKKVEDLGEQVIHGWETHGCRRTTTTANQIFVDEMWEEASGTETHSFRAAVQIKQDYPLNGRGSAEDTWDLTSLSFTEPDPRNFQPPDSYERKVYEMTEIPCDAPKTPPASPH